ncbi:hypothetical protein AI2916V1_4115 [Enterobacter cloacae]|nr:hypothetical protein AI2916V1_4115 [Enterobacter cloacae]
MSSRVGLISIFIVFLLVLIIQLLTPFHSDDFGFYLKGYSFETLHHVYMTWSGRLFSDFTGSLVMSIKDKTIISLINACAFTSLIVVLTKLPLENKNNWFVFVLLFMLYWIDNPSLSQTSFWVVGSANYLWTNLLAYSWLYLYFRYGSTSDVKMKALLLLMAFITGMTTENLSTSIFGVLFLYNALNFYRERKINWLSVSQMLLLLAGVGVLLLAPGNFVRSSSCCFDFYSQPLITRITNHFPGKFISEMMEYKHVIVLTAISICYGLYKKKDMTLPLLFVIGAIASNAMLFASPTNTGRVLNTGLVMMLASLSFALNSLSGFKVCRFAIYVSSVVSFVMFAQSYSNNYQSIKRVFAQDQIRTQMIKDGYDAIPYFYQGSIEKESDKLDIFFNAKAISEFYGATKEVGLIDLPFDYSLMTQQKTDINDSYFLNFRRLDDVFLFEVANSDVKFENYILFFRLTMADGSVENHDFIPVLRNYKGHLYINSWKVDTKGKEMKSFEIGFYDPKLKENVRSAKVSM